jgi:hypothetical protein
VTGRREALGAVALVALGVGLRLLFAAVFPTQPFSDFRALIDFALRLRDQGPAAPGWGWVQFNPGMPLVLSVLFRAAPADPASAARVATAILSGVTPLVPFLLWRPILAYRWRMLAGLLLALWPGQVFFSGVAAQENWVLLPSIALACLGVRALREGGGRGYPVAAGLLFAASAGIRQEMLVVLLPLALPAAGGLRWRRALPFALAAGVPLLALALERRAATGRFALTSEHGGLGLLGSAVPGSAAAGWADPTPHVASTDPELVKDGKRLRQESWRLAAAEWKRRYRFHFFRATVAGLRLGVQSDADNLYWSVGANEALPEKRRAAGAAVAARWGPWLRWELAFIQGLFAAAVFVGLSRRDPAILALCAAVLLKFAIQALVSPLGRLMVPAVALELLAIALAAASLRGARQRLLALAVAGAVAAALLLAVPPLQALAVAKDEAPHRVARFPIALPGGKAFAECSMDEGRLVALAFNRGRIAMQGGTASPGERAVVSCVLPPGRPDLPLELRIEDPYAPGGLPGRILERVSIDGSEVFSHDLAAEPGAGWLEVPLTRAGSPAPSRVSFEILAVEPDPGWAWGAASAASFELVEAGAR